MISLNHVTKRYGKTVALSDVTLEIRKGETAGLLGRNGAGKTTALNLMTGFFPPDSGSVAVDGMDMLRRSRECKRRIGYLPEQPPLYDEMTVREYLRFVSDLREVLPKAGNRHVEEILALCGLQESAGKVIGHLSKGFRQRVGIAQALCGNPEILIFDEPTVGLDPVQVVEIRDLIRQLGKEHTILFSSHILSEVEQLCSTALILHEGRLIRSFDMHHRDGLIRLELVAAGGEKDVPAALRSLQGVRSIEKLPAEEPGTVHLRLVCQEEEERGKTTDRIFYLLAALDTPIRKLMPEKNDLEATFLRTIQE